jgi:hypothetical protein
MVNRLRRPRLGDKWYLDEVFLTIHDERYSIAPAQPAVFVWAS